MTFRAAGFQMSLGGMGWYSCPCLVGPAEHPAFSTQHPPSPHPNPPPENREREELQGLREIHVR
jgi:hypothetical protein